VLDIGNLSVRSVGEARYGFILILLLDVWFVYVGVVNMLPEGC